MRNPRQFRIATHEPLAVGGSLTLSGNPAHYLTHVLRLKEGDAVALFGREEGEFSATISRIGKRDVELRIGVRSRPPETKTGLTVCFAPIKGGRLETIIEKATELGADVLQPVLTRRSVVDKVNVDRAESIAREAAEQCERTGWPEIREPVKLEKLLGDWPQDLPLIYGDESGQGIPITELVVSARSAKTRAASEAPRGGSGSDGGSSPNAAPAANQNSAWAVLIGPEGGFAPEEFAMLQRLKVAQPVNLGPRILRADTAVITLCAATLMAWGDWHLAPRFEGTDA